jgi:hypothetical protein
MTHGRGIAIAAALAFCAACGDRAAETTDRLGAGSELDPSDEQSQVEVPADATPEQAIELKAKKYAAGFSPDAPAIVGTLAEGARADHLLVLRAGHCYRIVGAGGPGVEDLDLFLFEPDGVQSQQDPGEDRYPVLGAQSEICPPRGSAYRVQVHMYRGAGAYGVRAYRTP